MENYKNILFCLIGIVTTTAIWYFVGAFITMNLTWFINSVSGRIIALILFIVTLGVNFKEL